MNETPWTSPHIPQSFRLWTTGLSRKQHTDMPSHRRMQPEKPLKASDFLVLDDWHRRLWLRISMICGAVFSPLPMTMKSCMAASLKTGDSTWKFSPPILGLILSDWIRLLLARWNKTYLRIRLFWYWLSRLWPTLFLRLLLQRYTTRKLWNHSRVLMITYNTLRGNPLCYVSEPLDLAILLFCWIWKYSKYKCGIVLPHQISQLLESITKILRIFSPRASFNLLSRC